MVVTTDGQLRMCVPLLNLFFEFKIQWLTDRSCRCTLSTLGPGWRTAEIQWHNSETKDWTSIKYTTGGWIGAIEESSAMYHINSLWRRMPARRFILLNADRYPSGSSRLMILNPCTGSWYKSMAQIWWAFGSRNEEYLYRKSLNFWDKYGNPRR